MTPSSSENLLATIPVKGKYNAAFWRERLSAIGNNGLENYCRTTAPFLDSLDTASVTMAQRTLRALQTVFRKLGASREALETIFMELQNTYRKARDILMQEKEVEGDETRLRLLHDYTQVHLNCHAYAFAILRVLQTKMAERRPVGNAKVAAKPSAPSQPEPNAIKLTVHQEQPATAACIEEAEPAGEGEEDRALYAAILEETVPAKTAHRPAPGNGAPKPMSLRDISIGPTLDPTRLIPGTSAQAMGQSTTLRKPGPVDKSKPQR
ncbi:MAG: hypothetical protein PHX93_00610 [Candidatus Peribacteraceae bacterium]|jgi:hypothetical protein|nr:hypothetical protein [Candidatus Peribacteraceae bacterium]